MSAYLPIRELAGGVLPTGIREGVLVMLRAYFDDSGSHDGSKVIVIGGLIGSVAQWEQFETAWAAKLAAPLPGKLPLSAFHLSHCAAMSEEFCSYNRPESDAVRHDFRQIILDADLISTAAAIDLVAWEELVFGPAAESIEHPLEICAARCIEETIRIAYEHPEGDAIAVFFDQGIESENLHRILDAYTHPLGRPRVVSITFARVKQLLPLQAADTIATEDYWDALRWVESGDTTESRAHLRHFLASAKSEAFILGREEIAAELVRREASSAASSGERH